MTAAQLRGLTFRSGQVVCFMLQAFYTIREEDRWEVQERRRERRQNGVPGSKTEVPGSEDQEVLELTVNHRPAKMNVRYDFMWRDLLLSSTAHISSQWGLQQSPEPQPGLLLLPWEASTEKGSTRAPSTSSSSSTNTNTPVTWVSESSTYPSAFCHWGKRPDKYLFTWYVFYVFMSVHSSEILVWKHSVLHGSVPSTPIVRQKMLEGGFGRGELLTSWCPRNEERDHRGGV